MSERLLLSVVVTTKNEEAHIEACLRAFDQEKARGRVETIVVDNGSRDATCAVAKALGAQVYQQGPERSAQRNRGAQEARADFVLFLDADMIVLEETLDEILERIATDEVDALYVREVRTGAGLRIQARNFERSFYNATCIDAVRVIRKALFLRLGGFDESLTSAEDWDLNRRIEAQTTRIALTDGHLLHNEHALSLKALLAKKVYYTQWFNRYQEKWHHDAIIRKQFGFYYRYIGVFVESGKWREVLAHPILFAVMMFERVLVGVVFLKARLSSQKDMSNRSLLKE